MKPPPRMRGNLLQLNLPLLNIPASLIPSDIHPDLVLALVDLLVGAVHTLEGRVPDGGDNDRETDR